MADTPRRREARCDCRSSPAVPFGDRSWTSFEEQLAAGGAADFPARRLWQAPGGEDDDVVERHSVVAAHRAADAEEDLAHVHAGRGFGLRLEKQHHPIVAIRGSDEGRAAAGTKQEMAA